MDEIERRWLLKNDPVVWPDIAVLPRRVDHLSQVYLDVHKPLVSRVRSTCERVTLNGEVFAGKQAHFHTVKMPGPELGHNLEIEREITSDELSALSGLIKPGTRAVIKRRTTFNWGGVTWELDNFMLFDLVILECELDSLHNELPTPPWLPIDREITKEAGWSNYEIAHQDWEIPNVT